jgi:hypothetical protein
MEKANIQKVFFLLVNMFIAIIIIYREQKLNINNEWNFFLFSGIFFSLSLVPRLPYDILFVAAFLILFFIYKTHKLIQSSSVW